MNKLLLAMMMGAAMWLGGPQSEHPDKQLQSAINKEVVEGDLKGAIEQYKAITALPGASRATVATALLRMGQCHEKLGQTEARTAYERLVREYGDQGEIVAQARARLAALGGTGRPGGLAARRILDDASAVDGILTADGKYLRKIDWYRTGDGIQYELSTGQTTRIPNKGGPEAIEGPYDFEAFSRDGKKTAYDFYTKDNIFQLRIRNFDGTGLRTLYSDDDKKFEIHPFDWSPDGKTILALRDLSTETEVALISAADGSMRVIRKNSSFLNESRFSADGRFIALSFRGEKDQAQGDIYLISADGKQEIIIAAHPAEDRLLAWTPDGKGLVFLSNRSGTWDIWFVSVAEGKQLGEPVLLKKDFGNESDILGFAPDGTLYYKSIQASGNLCLGEIDFEAGRLITPPVAVVTRYAGPVNFMSWSPDGKFLLYLSHIGAIGPGNNIITIRSVASGEERFLSPPLYGAHQISWAPDGRSIICLGYGFKTSDDGAYRIDAETSAIAKLADGGIFARLCPDGKTLVQYRDEGIVKIDLVTGKESIVAKGAAYRYALSPDGLNIAFQKDGAVMVAPFDGGATRELFRGEHGFFMPGWTGDGRYILACTYGEKELTVWRIPFQGGPPAKLVIAIQNMYNFQLHPDGRRFACGIKLKTKSELWVMENFLPPAKVAK